MIIEVERGDFTHVFADEPNETWSYIQRATAQEDKSYSGLKIGPAEKYTMCNVLCYKGEPMQFFTMNGSSFGEGVLRCYTAQYTLKKFRAFKSVNNVRTALHETVNYYSNVWPLISPHLPTYNLFFFSRLYGQSSLEKFFKSSLDHPELWTFGGEHLYRIGRNEQKPTAWKYVNYMGDVSLLARPRLTTEEYVSRFQDQIPG